MQNIALAWLVVELTHSPVAVGLLAFVRFAPFAMFSLPAGVLADRFDNRRTMMLTQAISMVVSAVLAAFVLLGQPPSLGDLRPGSGGRRHRGLRRAEPSRADVPAGRTRRAPERDRAQRQPLQRLACGRTGDRRRRDRDGRGRRLLRPQRASASSPSWQLWHSCDSRELFPLARRGSAADDQGESATGSATCGGRLDSARPADDDVVSTVGFNFHVLVPVLASKTLHVGAEVFGALGAAFGLGALAGALLAATFAKASWRALVLGSAGLQHDTARARARELGLARSRCSSS